MNHSMTLGGLAALLFSGAAPAAVTSQDWKISLDFGASFASGNTESTLVTSGFNADREIEKDIYSLSASYAWGEENGTTTSDSVLADASWKRLISERGFLGLRLDVRHDNLAAIDYRVSLSGLAGYFFVKEEDTKFSIEGGPGATLEKVGGVTDEYANLYFGEKFEHQLTPETKVYQTLAVFAPVEDFNDFQVVVEAGLETKLTERMKFKVYLEDKYENAPAPGRTENDVRVVTGVSISM